MCQGNFFGALSVIGADVDVGGGSCTPFGMTFSSDEIIGADANVELDPTWSDDGIGVLNTLLFLSRSPCSKAVLKE